MKKLLSVVIFLTLFALTTFAQGSLYLQSSTTGVLYDAFSGSYPFGYNAQMTIYPNGGGPFPATSSGACGYPYPTECNGVKVEIGTSFYHPFALLTYVSPYQINLVTPDLLTIHTTFTATVKVRNSGAAVTHAVNYTSFPQVAYPIVSYQAVQSQTYPLLAGSLYSSAGEFIKGLADGNPNPRTYGGQPTIVQGYFSGSDNTGGFSFSEVLNIFCDNVFLRNAPFIYRESPGVFLTNIESPPGGWEAGLHTIMFRYDGFYVDQPSIFNAYVWWAE